MEKDGGEALNGSGEPSGGEVKQEITPETVVARLVIEMRADSSVRVEGCIADKVLSYGLLQAAKDAIFERHLQTKLVPVQTGGRMLNFLRGKR